MRIAALYVEEAGPYAGLPDVDLWGITRDARLYAGPWPVVAHPPCGRWCRLAGLVEARGGARRGEDDGCFAAALSAVRRWGGVLEHPAESAAWRAFGLFAPNRAGGWTGALDGSWTCAVDQSHYGHAAQKTTWLYVTRVTWLPSLAWERRPTELVVSPSRRVSGRKGEMRKSQRHITPVPFRDLLLSIARSCPVQEAA